MSHTRFRLILPTLARFSILGLALFGVIVLGASDKVVKVAKGATNGDIGGDSMIVETAPIRMASRVQVDPKTGELQFAPTSGVPLTLTPELRNALSSSTVGLQVETGAGGGKMVRLQGRFRHLSSISSVGDSVGSVRCFDGSLLDSAKSVEQDK